jgi:hypothetical protein
MRACGGGGGNLQMAGHTGILHDSAGKGTVAQDDLCVV